MNLNLKRLSLASARLEILTKTETDLKAQFLELMGLRERLQQATRARKPAPVVIAAAACNGQPPRGRNALLPKKVIAVLQAAQLLPTD